MINILTILYLHIIWIVLFILFFIAYFYNILKLGKVRKRIVSRKQIIVFFICTILSIFLFIPIINYVQDIEIRHFRNLKLLSTDEINSIVGSLRGVWFVVVCITVILLEYNENTIRKKGVFVKYNIIKWENISGYKVQEGKHKNQTRIIFNINKKLIFSREQELEWNIAEKDKFDIEEILQKNIQK